MLSNSLRLNFFFFKIVHFLHPRYHPAIIGDILKKYTKKQVCLFKQNYMTKDNENKAKNEKQITQIRHK